MEQNNKITLAEAYNKSEYPILGNGKWNVQLLKEALEHVDGGWQETAMEQAK